MGRERPDFSGVAEAVLVDVMPDGELPQLAASQFAIAVVVQCGERVVAVLLEQPERDAAEPLQGGRDASGPVLIVDQPAGVWRDPRPPPVNA